jgi:hypothetical protein
MPVASEEEGVLDDCDDFDEDAMELLFEPLPPAPAVPVVVPPASGVAASSADGGGFTLSLVWGVTGHCPCSMEVTGATTLREVRRYIWDHFPMRFTLADGTPIANGLIFCCDGRVVRGPPLATLGSLGFTGPTRWVYRRVF